MPEIIPSRWDLADSSPVENAWAVGAEVYRAIRAELGTPDILRPPHDSMRFGAQVQSAIGTSDRYLVVMNFETERALRQALLDGLLLDLAKMSVEKARERVEFAEGATIRVRYNSWEYIGQHGDGFHRQREGDWRDDFEFEFDGEGKLSKRPGDAG